MPRKARGRPLKFGRPARLLALTLPQDVVAWLQGIHPDPAWAIVELFERLGNEDGRARPASTRGVELAQLSSRRGLIVVDPRTIRSVPGVSVVPVAMGRAFLAFEEGRSLADLELAVHERLQNANTAERPSLRQLHRQIREWRRSRRHRFSTRSIILVERVTRPRPGGRSQERPG